MAKKIAPVLTDTVNAMERMGLGYAPMKARRELRALLAVAKAARWWVEADMKFEKGTPANALHAAMTRLDKVSGRKGEGRP